MPAPDLNPLVVPPGGALMGSPLPLHGVTMLVVEDSRFASEALRLMCQRSGARMRRVESMAAARRHLAMYRPDVVIVDIGLPDGSGVDLIRDFAGAAGFGPALLATSGDAALRGPAIAAGAVGFLDKPVEDLATFQAAVLRLFPGAPQLRPSQAALLQAGPPPDLMALSDDLALIAERLAGQPGTEERRYLAGFLHGLARSARDTVLAQAADQAALADSNLPELAALIRARLSCSPPPFGKV